MSKKLKLDLLTLREEWRKDPNYSCFWSSPDNPRGLRLTPTMEPGRAFVEMKVERELSGYPGIAHGGIAFTILDGLMGWLIMSNLGRAALTTECHVKYTSPLHVGSTYVFEVTFKEKLPEDKLPRLLSTVGRVYQKSSPKKTLVEMSANMFLPNRKLAEKILDISIKDLSSAVFPEKG